MSNAQLPECVREDLLEAALQASVTQRCQRAYVHELRNGLQGIYASIDVLTRIAEGKMPATVSPDKVKEMSRKALAGHEHAINQAITQLTLQQDAAVAIDVAVAFREVASFLGNDAAMHDVELQATAEADSYVLARPSRFRLALLAMMVRAIDAMRSGGRLEISALMQGQTVEIEFSMLSNDAAMLDDGAWNFSANRQLSEDWKSVAVGVLVQRDLGSILSLAASAQGGDSGFSKRRAVKVIYRAAKPSSPGSDGLSSAPSPC